jgi:hypothetical protein
MPFCCVSKETPTILLPGGGFPLSREMSNRYYYEWSRSERKFVVWDRKLSIRLAFCPDRDVAERICNAFMIEDYKESLKTIERSASANSDQSGLKGKV